MRSAIGFLLAVWGANLSSALEYRTAFVMQAAFMALNNFIFLAFWGVFFARFERVRGWELSDVALLYAVTATSFGLMVVLLGGLFDLAREIAAGGLDSWLLRPRPVLMQAATARMVVSGLGDVASGLALLLLSGNAHKWPLFALMVLASGTAFAGFVTLLNALAFFLGSAEELASHGTNALITFALYPAGLFGGRARIMLYVAIPAGLVSYTPAALLQSWSWHEASLLALGVAAFLALAALAWRAGLRRYESGNLTQRVQA